MNWIRHGRGLALTLVAAAWLAGCASIPAPIRDGPEHGVDPALVRAAPQQYPGATVRWGGIIAAVENRADESVVEMVSRPLSRSGRPRETDATSGRFIARIPGFLDPAVYAVGREFTVLGQVDGVTQRNIGGYRYDYPVVRASGHHLWPVLLPPMQDPFYYSPFYRWPPYGPYPFR